MTQNVKTYERSRQEDKSEAVKNLSLGAILLALGTVTHTVFRGPDFLLACMFVAISMTNTKKEVLVLVFASSILTGMTQSSPIGTIASFFDKFISGYFFLFLYRTLGEKRRDNIVIFAVIVAIATFLSGYIYFASSLGLAKVFGIAKTASVAKRGVIIPILTLVSPTALINALIATSFKKALKLSRF